jgi:CheY-like chemotaxis protein
MILSFQMKKVIIVDDSKVGLFIDEMLKKQRRYQTIIYRTGLEAIREIGENSCFDLALVDVGLPDMSGEKVIEYLATRYPHKPVICISSYRGHQSPSAIRTIHKGSATRIDRLVEILEQCCQYH